MKIRARVKAVEHLPDWYKCCPLPEGSNWLHPGEEFTVDLSDKKQGNKSNCTRCGAEQPEGTDVTGFDDTGEAFWVPLEILDLDEGPMEAQ